MLASSMKWLIAALAVLPLPDLARAQDDDDYHLGLLEYDLACLPCHGKFGAGDGPLAAELGTPPSDLTQIAAANGGVFPARRVFEIIDGRALVEAHNQRDMPVWGDRYRRDVGEGQSWFEVEHLAVDRIEALVRFVEGLQDVSERQDPPH